MAFGGMVITSKGRNALIKAQNGGKLEFLHVAIGDGTYSGSFNSVSRLTNQLFTIPIVNFKTEKDTCILEADLNNTDFTNDFYLREIGIYVKDGDQPILYTYDNAGSDAQFISGGEDALKEEKRLRFVLKISDVSSVTAETISTLYTVQTEFEGHILSQDNHVTAEKQIYWNNKLGKKGDASSLVSQVQAYTERENIVAGETLSHSFGKIKRWFTDLKPHAFQDKINNTDIEDLDASKLKGKIDLKVLPDSVLDINILEKTYPIGSIYLSVNYVNPSNYFGGIWEEWGVGRVPVGVDTNQTEFNTVQKTGGTKTQALDLTDIPAHAHSVGAHTHGLNSHTHSIPALSGTAASAGTHTHGIQSAKQSSTGKWGYDIANDGVSKMQTSSERIANSGAHTHKVTTSANTTGATSASTAKSTAFNTSAQGGEKEHNNLQPYITCYMWKRIS